MELHFDEIPSLELENILHLRCAIPVSYCKKIIGVMKDLQVIYLFSSFLKYIPNMILILNLLYKSY